MQSFFRFNFFQQHRFESPYRSKGRLKQDFRRPETFAKFPKIP